MGNSREWGLTSKIHSEASWASTRVSSLVLFCFVLFFTQSHSSHTLLKLTQMDMGPSFFHMAPENWPLPYRALEHSALAPQGSLCGLAPIPSPIVSCYF